MTRPGMKIPAHQTKRGPAMALERDHPRKVMGDFFPLFLIPILMISGLLIIPSLSGIWSQGLSWAAATLFIFLGELLLVQVTRNRHKHGLKGRPAMALGAADYVTLVRGFLLACSGGFIVTPRPLGWVSWVPGLFYLLAVIGDGLDGYIARKLNRPTGFGQALDHEFDSLGTLLGTILVFHYRQIPAWYLLVGLGRYLFLAGVWAREIRGFKPNPLPKSKVRGLIGGANSVFLGLAMTPVLTFFASTLLSLPFFALLSLSFIRDWLAVSGSRYNDL